MYNVIYNVILSQRCYNDVRTMDRFEQYYNEMRFRREMDQALSLSFEYFLNETSNKKILKLKSRLKKYDSVFETFRCNKTRPLSDDMCSICQFGFKRNQIIRKTCSNCHFHALCIDKWLVNAKSKTCPNCVVILNNI